MVPRSPGFLRRMKTRSRWPVQSSSSHQALGHFLETVGRRLKTGSNLKRSQPQDGKWSFRSRLRTARCRSRTSEQCSLHLLPAGLTETQSLSETRGCHSPHQSCWRVGVLWRLKGQREKAITWMQERSLHNRDTSPP